jgi:hypothetical protein
MDSRNILEIRHYDKVWFINIKQIYESKIILRLEREIFIPKIKRYFKF